MSGMAIVLHIPEVLRAKLGEDGARELANLFNEAVKNLRENVSETAAERLERRIVETKAEIKVEIAEKTAAIESRLVWKMLAFLAGQTGVLYLLIKATH